MQVLLAHRRFLAAMLTDWPTGPFNDCDACVYRVGMSPDVAARRPILPPEDSSPRAKITALRALVLTSPKHLTLSDGETCVQLPEQVAAALKQVLDALSQGQAITILPTATSLTTQQAAEVLRVSRPTLIKILEAGEIPFMAPGRGRRILLTDVLAYQLKSAQRTDRALTELMQDSAQYFGPTDADADHQTR